MIKCPKCGKSTFRSYDRLIYSDYGSRYFYVDEYVCFNCDNDFRYMLTLSEADRHGNGMLVDESIFDKKMFTNPEI